MLHRTWYRKQSDGTFFRNTGLVRLDQERLENRLIPGRQRALNQEWGAIFHAGVTESAILPPGDRYTDWDDSPEATDAWVAQLMARYGHPQNKG